MSVVFFVVCRPNISIAGRPSYCAVQWRSPLYGAVL